MQIYLSVNAEERGPYSVEELRELRRAHAIPDDAYYWYEGCESWQVIAAFPDAPPATPTEAIRPPQPGAAVDAGSRPAITKTTIILAAVALLAGIAWFVVLPRFETTPSRHSQPPGPSAPRDTSVAARATPSPPEPAHTVPVPTPANPPPPLVDDPDPAPVGMDPRVVAWLQKNNLQVTGTEDAQRVDYQGEMTWARRYQLTGRNGFGMPVTAHVLCYFRNGQCIATGEVESDWEVQSRKQQAADAALQDELQRGLRVTITKATHDGRTIQIYGRVANTTARYAVKFLSIKLKGLNSKSNLVADTSTFATGENYLRPGKEATFSSTLDDPDHEVTSVVPALDSIASHQIQLVEPETISPEVAAPSASSADAFRAAPPPTFSTPPSPLGSAQSLTLPLTEKAFIATVQSYTDLYNSAPNELKKTAVRMQRKVGLASSFPERAVVWWIGTLKEMKTDQKGNASIVIELDGSSIRVHPDSGNPFDPHSSTLIPYGSKLYEKISTFSVGEKVGFCGSFLPGDQDYLKESSFTEAGSMREPEFAMLFTDLTEASNISLPDRPEPANDAASAPAPPVPPLGSAPPSNPRYYAVTNVPEGDTLSVHSGPDSKTPVVARLPEGYDRTEIIGGPIMNGKTEWVQIKFPTGAGWVTTKYLSAR